ncbi:hypothetical protein [Paremcibacter congregatus]|uniref:hypothetical protein n=1 Tax=Paremcibacter congregatus TaxID=2043170 RepID=UPI003A959234
MKRYFFLICLTLGALLMGYLIGAGVLRMGDIDDEGRTTVRPDLNYDLPDNVHVVKGESRETSVVWTNLGPGSFEEFDKVLAIPIEEPIYDIGFSFYSEWYAETYGFPKSHVRQLPEHVQFMEYRMQTLGRMKNCYLNMLLDKGLGLNLPDHPFSSMLSMGSSDDVRLTRPKRVEGWTESDSIRAFRQKWKGLGARQGSNNKYIFRNAFITSVPYAPSFKKKKSGKLLGLLLHSYNPWFYEGLDYVSVSLTCSALTQVFHEQPEFFLWLKKKDGKDYARHRNPDREDFLIFEVPMELRQKILPFMKTGRNGGWEFYQKVFEKIKPSPLKNKEKGS